MTTVICVILMYIGTIIFLPITFGKEIVIKASNGVDFATNYFVDINFISKNHRIGLALIIFLASSFFWFYLLTSNYKGMTSIVWIISVSLLILIFYVLFIKKTQNKSLLLFITTTCLTLPLLIVPVAIYLIAKIWYMTLNAPIAFAVTGYLIFNGGLLLFLIINS